MYTKGDVVELVFAELALAGFVFDSEPEEKAFVLQKLDLMMAEWAALGIKVGYSLPPSPSASRLATSSGLPDSTVNAVALNCAKRVAPTFGKVLSPETLSAASQGYSQLLWNAAIPPQQQYPDTLPQGAGNKPWRVADAPFMPVPDTSPLSISPGGGLSIQE